MKVLTIKQPWVTLIMQKNKRFKFRIWKTKYSGELLIHAGKRIDKEAMFLSQKAKKATKEDKYIANDLLDTLKANKDRSVGLAANMIGYNKAIVCVSSGLYNFIMINPVITNKSGEYQTEEGCLSLIEKRKCKR